MTKETMPKVLVVDDEPYNVELMDAYLSMDYDVLTAYEGKEALEIVRTKEPDLIILDIMMPGMSGYEVCRILKEDPKTQFIPIIIATALSEVEDRVKGKEAGADDFLTKPINNLELTTRVKSLLRVKHLHDSLVAERDQLDMQNRIRSILTAIIPTLLNSAHPEQKRIIIHQMTEMVEKVIMEKYSLGEEYIRAGCASDDCDKIEYITTVCANVMNNLGGHFSIVEWEDENTCTVKGDTCPWGAEEARANPILCNLTRGIFSRLASRSKEKYDVEVLKTIGNRDECCLFKFRRF